MSRRLGAFLGHLFPVWLKFKGGKGVATYIGVLLGLAWPAAIVFCVVWLAVAALSRYSSLSALIASLATPVLWAMRAAPEAVLFLGLTLMLWTMHRDNIGRLLNGTEGKIGQKPRQREQLKPPSGAARRIVCPHHIILHRNANMERHQRQKAEGEISVGGE